MSYTVKHEHKGQKNRGRDEGFVVRDEHDRYQASFAWRYEAELYATMMNCKSCKEDVSAHLRFKEKNFQPDRHDHPPVEPSSKG